MASGKDPPLTMDVKANNANNSAFVQGAGAHRLLQADSDSKSDQSQCDGKATKIVPQDITKLKDYLSEKVGTLNLSSEASFEEPPKLEGGDEDFLCGWAAAFVNISITFPINKAIFRQQLHGISGFKAMRQLKKEGLRMLYRGLLPPLLQKTTSSAIMFGFYNKFGRELDARVTGVPRHVNHAAAAMMAGTMEVSLTPFERIQSLLQNRVYQERFNNTFHAAKELWAYGLKEYYRGVTCIFLRNGPSNIIFFLGKESLTGKRPENTSEHTSKLLAKDFLTGSFLGAFISTMFFPLNVVKTRMQSQVGGRFLGVFQTFQLVWVERNRSVSSLFRGFHLNYTRSFVSWGIINMTYEILRRFSRSLKEEKESDAS